MKLPPEALVAAKVRANAHMPRLRLPRKYSLRKFFPDCMRLEKIASARTASVYAVNVSRAEFDPSTCPNNMESRQQCILAKKVGDYAR